MKKSTFEGSPFPISLISFFLGEKVIGKATLEHRLFSTVLEKFSQMTLQEGVVPQQAKLFRGVLLSFKHRLKSSSSLDFKA